MKNRIGCMTTCGTWIVAVAVACVNLTACVSKQDTDTGTATGALNLDLANYEARDEFVGYATWGERIWPTSLIETCGLRTIPDRYRVVADVAFQEPESQFVEIRRQGSEGIVTVYDGQPAPPPPPDSSRSQGKTESGKMQIGRTAKVSPEAMQALSTAAEQLIENRVAPTRGEMTTDGVYLIVEFCKNNRYGYFSRRNPASNRPDDAYVAALANLILTAAKAKPVPLGTDMSLNSRE